MRDQEINRKVAELRGFTIRETHEECSGYVPGAVWVSGGDYYEQIVTWCIPNAYVEAWDGSDDPQNQLDWYQYCGVSDVCNDPAAWGALYQQLAEESMQITLIFIRRPKPLLEWGATIWRGHKMWEASADSPGKALALAYIAASEVTK